jgi:hypothetical protein
VAATSRSVGTSAAAGVSRHQRPLESVGRWHIFGVGGNTTYTQQPGATDGTHAEGGLFVVGCWQHSGVGEEFPARVVTGSRRRAKEWRRHERGEGATDGRDGQGVALQQKPAVRDDTAGRWIGIHHRATRAPPGCRHRSDATCLAWPALIHECAGQWSGGGGIGDVGRSAVQSKGFVMAIHTRIDLT